jgi:broad specificity phosphatase PhoE
VTRIVLVRHGAVEAGGRAYGQVLDPSLSTAGHAEVAALRDRLGSAAASAVIRSPARRAAETVSGLGHGAAAVDAAWSERHLGAWEGRRWTELWDEVPPEVLTDPAAYAAFVPPGAEPMDAVQARVVAALQDIAERDGVERPGEAPPVLVVTHGGPILCALRWVLDLDAATTFRLRVGTGTATWLTAWPDGSWTIEGVGT